MTCDNLYCKFYAESQCTLETISLDILGSCKDFRQVKRPEEYLKKEKEKSLARISAQKKRG